MSTLLLGAKDFPFLHCLVSTFSVGPVGVFTRGSRRLCKKILLTCRGL